MNNKKKGTSALIIFLVIISLVFSGSSQSTPSAPSAKNGPDVSAIIPDTYTDDDFSKSAGTKVYYLEDDSVALSASPAACNSSLIPKASGTLVKKSPVSEIDYSNTKDGYIMVRYTSPSSKKIKVLIKGPSITYTYNINVSSSWSVFPLTDGNGSYTAVIFQNVDSSKYATVSAVTFNVSLSNELAPFIRPNQYVDFSNAPATVSKAAELTANSSTTLDKVQNIYNYVVSNISYDTQKAQTVQSGYLPVLDDILSQKKGICFDYAALMTGMLRSQGIPCKLIIGYAGTQYHAWISVYTEESGWIDGIIHFNGKEWHRMDPTFASTGKQSDSIMQFIGDGTNYTSKYIY